MSITVVIEQNGAVTGTVINNDTVNVDVLPVAGRTSGIHIDEYETSGVFQWSKPVGAKWHKVIMTGAGTGGGSGQKGATAGVGGGGGASGATVIEEFHPDDITDTVTITIPAGGTGGAAVTANTTNGNGGGSGGRTSFGGYMSAGGGTGGVGGGVAGGSNAPGGNSGSNLILTGISGNQGGIGRNTSAPDIGIAANHSSTGGGGGGGITSNTPGDGADAQYRGGATSQASGPDAIHSGGVGGTVGATLNGTNGTAFGKYGTGGGGGAASTTSNAGNGGNGMRGGGGGGGGAALNDIGNSGAGGNGGDGYCIVITYF